MGDVMTVRTVAQPITVDTYYRLARSGAYPPNHRTELIEGRVYVMAPPGPIHALTVAVLTTRLARALGDDVLVSPQNPLRMSRIDEPQPDLVVIPRRSGLARRHPSQADALLVVEVAVTSLTRDRRRKLPRYAAFGIPEVWLVIPWQQCIEVYTAPAEGRYLEVERLEAGSGAVLTPRRLPDVRLPISELLDEAGPG
jgi:Uma2 family endonuclease